MTKTPSTFEEYYRAYHRPMVDRVRRAVTYRMSWEEAEEVVQEMWITAMDAWERCDEPADKRGSWIIGILNNKVRHVLRNRERCGRPATINVIDFHTLEDLVVDEDAPAEVLEGMQSAMEYNERMEELDEFNAGYYEVVYMSRVYGLKLREIADRLGISLGTVRSRLSRGLQFLEAGTKFNTRHGTSELPRTPVITPPSVKATHPWYAPHGYATGPTYRPRQTPTRPTHYNLGGTPGKPNCPGYRKCPVCAHFNPIGES